MAPQPQGRASVTSSNSSLNLDEPFWMIQIRRNLETELEDEDEIPICISSVPKSLLSFKPEAYIPQQLALGPYHYWRPELYEMGRLKLAAAKRTQKQLSNGLKFQHLVEHLTKLDSRIRACYHKYLDFDSQTLAWILAVDATFLLEFLQVYAIKEGNKFIQVRSSSISSSASGQVSQLIDFARRKSAHNLILKDIVMLENQIPLFLLRKILELQFSLDIADDILYSMFIGISKELSPFNMMDETIQSFVKITDSTHLLDFLYHILVPQFESGDLGEDSDINKLEEEDEDHESMDGKQESFGNRSHFKQLLNEVWKALLNLEISLRLARFLKKTFISGPVKFVAKLPWTVISRLPVVYLLKKPMEKLFISLEDDKEEIKPENRGSSKSSHTENRPPLMEEIAIPSVSELHNAGVRFLPTTGNIGSICFDVKEATFHLPTVSFDVTTDVVLRNLVAYEASTVAGPLVFTRYTELMNGIIDTKEDAKLLREKGIVLNHLKNDQEVADVWNGMSKSVRLTKVPLLDKLIEDVNTYYNGRWKVKIRKFMRNSVFSSWQFLTFLAAMLLLLLTGFQAFCSIFRCARFLQAHHPAANSSAP